MERPEDGPWVVLELAVLYTLVLNDDAFLVLHGLIELQYALEPAMLPAAKSGKGTKTLKFVGFSRHPTPWPWGASGRK